MPAPRSSATTDAPRRPPLRAASQPGAAPATHCPHPAPCGKPQCPRERRPRFFLAQTFGRVAGMSYIRPRSAARFSADLRRDSRRDAGATPAAMRARLPPRCGRDIRRDAGATPAAMRARHPPRCGRELRPRDVTNPNTDNNYVIKITTGETFAQGSALRTV